MWCIRLKHFMVKAIHCAIMARANTTRFREHSNISSSTYGWIFICWDVTYAYLYWLCGYFIRKIDIGCICNYKSAMTADVEWKSMWIYRWIPLLPMSMDIRTTDIDRSRDRVPIDGRLFSLASQLSSSKPFDVRYNHFDWNRSDWCWKQRWFTPHKNSFRSAHQRNHFNSCSTKTLSFPMS